jgi:hypothetical protein
MAVSDKLFEKRIGFICPCPECNGRIIKEFKYGVSIPKVINCTICEAEGREESSYDTSDLKRIEFYKLG